MRDCGFVEFSQRVVCNCAPGSVETDGRLRRRRIETELICWWSVESVKRCEAWEEMKEEKSDSPVDEGATRTDTLFLVACVRVPCARLPELTNEEKNGNGSGTGDGGGKGKSKMQPAKRTERSHPRIRPAADDAQRRDQSDEQASRRTGGHQHPDAMQRSAAAVTGTWRLRDERTERRGPGPLPPCPRPCLRQPNGYLPRPYSHDRCIKAQYPSRLTTPGINSTDRHVPPNLSKTSRPEPFAFEPALPAPDRMSAVLSIMCWSHKSFQPSIHSCCRLIAHPLRIGGISPRRHHMVMVCQI